MQRCGARRTLSKGYHADKHGDLTPLVKQTPGACKGYEVPHVFAGPGRVWTRLYPEEAGTRLPQDSKEKTQGFLQLGELLALSQQ